VGLRTVSPVQVLGNRHSSTRIICLLVGGVYGVAPTRPTSVRVLQGQWRASLLVRSRGQSR
jgi:hypothetical protein